MKKEVSYQEAINNITRPRTDNIKEQLDEEIKLDNHENTEVTAVNTKSMVVEMQNQTKILDKIRKGFNKFLFRMKDMQDDIKDSNNTSSNNTSVVNENKKQTRVIKPKKEKESLSLSEALVGAWVGKTILGKLGRTLKVLDSRAIRGISKAVTSSLAATGLNKTLSKLNTTMIKKSYSTIEKVKNSKVVDTVKKSKPIRTIHNMKAKLPKTPEIVKRPTRKILSASKGMLSKAVTSVKGVGSKIPYLNVLFAGYFAKEGWDNVKEILDIKNDIPTLRQKMIAGLSSAIDGFTFGLLDEKVVGQTIDKYTSFIDNMFNFNREDKEFKKSFVGGVYSTLEKTFGVYFKKGTWLNGIFGDIFESDKKPNIQHKKHFRTHKLSKPNRVYHSEYVNFKKDQPYNNDEYRNVVGGKKVEGTVSWRNNNPGNIRYNPKTAKWLGGEEGERGFLKFPTLEAGKKAYEKLMFEEGIYRHMSVRQAISRYAPKSENDTEQYIRVVTRAAGVSENTKLEDMTKEQRERFMKAQFNHEGFEVGKVIKPNIPKQPKVDQVAAVNNVNIEDLKELKKKKDTETKQQNQAVTNVTNNHTHVSSNQQKPKRDKQNVANYSLGVDDPTVLALKLVGA